MVLIEMREHDRIEMSHVVARERGGHSIVEAGVDHECGGAVGDENRVRLPNVHDADSRRGEVTPPHVAGTEDEQRRGARAKKTPAADPWPKDEQRDACRHGGGKKGPRVDVHADARHRQRGNRLEHANERLCGQLRDAQEDRTQPGNRRRRHGKRPRADRRRKEKRERHVRGGRHDRESAERGDG